MQQPTRHAPANPFVVQAHRQQLPQRDATVLARRERRDPRIKRGGVPDNRS
jgi:hypothetical protein